MAESIVDVQELRKRYDGAKDEAVRGISFDIGAGEIFGLLGPNGAGKTTTIGVMTTRVIATAGRVTVAGFDVSRDAASVKQRIAVVPQIPNLDRSLTARENLVFHAAYFGFSRRERGRRADELLEAFGLGGRGGDKVNNYSGGMAQRLMIARALMHRPQLLFLDEPTTGLDPQARLFLWDQIEQLRADGTTILITTHDMHEAERLCDRIGVVDHGELIALDTPAGLRQLLPGDAGIEVTVSGGTPDALRAALEPIGTLDLGDDDGHATPGDEADAARSVRVYGDATPSQVALALRDGGDEAGSLQSLRRIEGSLEDVFVHLTGRELR